jgi:hypothetical protein
MSKDNFQTDFTKEQARKIHRLNHPLKPIFNKNMVGNATDEEVEQFLQKITQPRRRRKKGIYNLSFAKRISKNLNKGKVQFIDGKLENPAKLDLSNFKPKQA